MMQKLYQNVGQNLFYMISECYLNVDAGLQTIIQDNFGKFVHFCGKTDFFTHDKIKYREISEEFPGTIHFCESNCCQAPTRE
jgi:hypothetical protein